MSVTACRESSVISQPPNVIWDVNPVGGRDLIIAVIEMSDIQTLVDANPSSTNPLVLTIKTFQRPEDEPPYYEIEAKIESADQPAIAKFPCPIECQRYIWTKLNSYLVPPSSIITKRYCLDHVKKILELKIGVFAFRFVAGRANLGMYPAAYDENGKIKQYNTLSGYVFQS